jgi:hypothetical protein
MQLHLDLVAGLAASTGDVPPKLLAERCGIAGNLLCSDQARIGPGEYPGSSGYFIHLPLTRYLTVLGDARPRAGHPAATVMPLSIYARDRYERLAPRAEISRGHPRGWARRYPG